MGHFGVVCWIVGGSEKPLSVSDDLYVQAAKAGRLDWLETLWDFDRRPEVFHLRSASVMEAAVGCGIVSMVRWVLDREPFVPLSNCCFFWPVETREPGEEGKEVDPFPYSWGIREGVEHWFGPQTAVEIMNLLLNRAFETSFSPLGVVYRDLVGEEVHEYAISRKREKREEFDRVGASLIEAIGRKFPSLEPPTDVLMQAVKSLSVRGFQALRALPCHPGWCASEVVGEVHGRVFDGFSLEDEA